ncbi:MAG: hypothetical protein H6686_02995 [Fibrobacteria bacterium]|nr:hypothetical protein [Fibrobacteria bacterium]
MPESRRHPSYRRLLALAIPALLSCAPDRSASGTTGTEAGNALSLLVTRPDGAPAAQAQVVARPSQDIDASGSSRWVHATADSLGRVVLHLEDGDWTLETRAGECGRVSRIEMGADSLLRDTLLETRPLEGVLLGMPAGRTLALPGLGRSQGVASSGAFRFEAMPVQELRLSLEGEQTWRATPDTSPLFLSTHVAEAVLFDPVRMAVDGQGQVEMALVADSLWPGSPSLLLDPSGYPLPMILRGAEGATRRVWTRVPRGEGTVYLYRTSLPVGAFDSLFDPTDGTRLDVVPDLDPELSDLSRSGGRLLADSILRQDSLFGTVLEAPLGATLGSIPEGLPDTGPFSISFQARLLSPGIESLWLLDWSIPAGQGVRVGVGGRRLRVLAAGRDTSVVWDPQENWFGVTVAWDGTALVVACDGRVQVRMEIPPQNWADRTSWTRREVGRGGGLRIRRIVVRSGGHDPEVLSRPVARWALEPRPLP